jgi:hypothetical protein
VAPAKTVPTHKAGKPANSASRNSLLAAACGLPWLTAASASKNRSLRLGASRVACLSRTVGPRLEGYPFIVADPDTDSPDPLRRAKQARAQSQALRNQVAEAAETVAEVEQEAARLHQILADQGGPLADQAREHAERAEALAAKERVEAQHLREADRG